MLKTEKNGRGHQRGEIISKDELEERGGLTRCNRFTHGLSAEVEEGKLISTIPKSSRIWRSISMRKKFYTYTNTVGINLWKSAQRLDYASLEIEEQLEEEERQGQERPETSIDKNNCADEMFGYTFDAVFNRLETESYIPENSDAILSGWRHYKEEDNHYTNNIAYYL